MTSNTYCYGEECAVRTTCLRYTLGLSSIKNGNDKYFRKCTSQKKYVQDKTKVKSAI